jgi:hypothetical protein
MKKETAKPFDEKRTETRFPINSIAKITILKTEKVVMGTCRNISGSGLLICAEKTITPNSMVRIEITEGKIEFKAEATVVRVAQDEKEILIALRITKQF